MVPVLLLTMIGGSMGGPLFARNSELLDCSDLDGVIKWRGGCVSYGECIRGQHFQRDCLNGTVLFSPTSSECVDPAAARFPCSITNMDCSQHVLRAGYRLPLMVPDPDGLYPLCSFYYNCVYGHFFHIQWCPDGEVYDEMNQRCGNPLTLPPPCGFAAQLSDQEQNVFPPIPGGFLDQANNGPYQIGVGGPQRLDQNAAREIFGTGQYQQNQRSRRGQYGQRQNRNTRFGQRQYRQGQAQNQFAGGLNQNQD